MYKNYLVGDLLLFDWDPKFWFNETDTEVKVEEVSTLIWDVVGMLTTFCCNFLVATGFNELKNVRYRNQYPQKLSIKIRKKPEALHFDSNITFQGLGFVVEL